MSSESGKVIYARIPHNFTLLRNTLFRLLIVAAPMIANALSDIVRCAIKQEMKLKSYFNLAPSINTILSQDPNYNILTFHSTLNELMTILML
jgi:hypothetical protein